MSFWTRFFWLRGEEYLINSVLYSKKKKKKASFVGAFAEPHNGMFNPLWDSGFCYSIGVSWPGRDPLKAADISCGKQKKKLDTAKFNILRYLPAK